MKRELTPDVAILDEPFTPVAQPVTLALDVVVGGRDVVLMAGPCSVESYEQTCAVAAVVAAAAKLDVIHNDYGKVRMFGLQAGGAATAVGKG